MHIQYNQNSYKRQPAKVEWRQVAYTLPFLFLSGVFTGIGIMLMIGN